MRRKLPALVFALALVLCLCTAAQALDTSKDSGLLVLVNKTHMIPSSYVPATSRLGDYAPVTASSVAMRPEATQAYSAMYQAMCQDGVKTFYGLSGYRSYATQSYLVNSRVNAQTSKGVSWQTAYNNVTVYTAPAGASEHQTGLAIDVGTAASLDANFDATPAGQWLAQHAWEYGFILRYEKAKTELTMIGDEAWHYRYVGAPHAKFMVDNGLCMEEYIDYLHTHGSAFVQIGDVCYHIYWTDDAAREFPGENITDVSSDNAGGWIVTTSHSADELFHVKGHWSESAFRRLKESGAVFSPEVLPEQAVTDRELAGLCGFEGGAGQALTREEAAAFLASRLPDQTLTRLIYRDLEQIGAGFFQDVQTAVSNKLFAHGEGQDFRPKSQLTWAEAAVLALNFRSATAPVPQETVPQPSVPDV